MKKGDFTMAGSDYTATEIGLKFVMRRLTYPNYSIKDNSESIRQALRVCQE